MQVIQKRAEGFTLLEVLVALGIAATSLMAMYSLAGQMLQGTAAIDHRQAALWCADNQLISVSLLRFAPNASKSEADCTQLGHTYTVSQQIMGTPNPMLRRIELSVYHKADPLKPDGQKSERLAFLATVLPNDAGPQ